MAEFRYHPIVENLKCNEDGSVILRNGEQIRIKHGKKGTPYIHIADRRLTVLRIVCECWHGMADDGNYAARKIDENKGNHYTNLHWSKQGLTKATAKLRDYSTELKITKAEYDEIETFRAKKEIQKELKKRGHSPKAWQNAKKRYGKN